MGIQTRRNQHGGSFLGNVFLLVLFVYGVYLAIQYVPLFIESSSLDSVLGSIEGQHQGNPYQGAQQVEQTIRNQLNLNQMDDMMQNVRVRESGNSISIEISYQRELDLVFQEKVLHYNKTLDLD